MSDVENALEGAERFEPGSALREETTRNAGDLHVSPTAAVRGVGLGLVPPAEENAAIGEDAGSDEATGQNGPLGAQRVGSVER